MKTLSFNITCIISLLFLASCSKLQEEKLPTQTAVSVHGQGFGDSTDVNFHGKYLQANNYDVTKCQSCHGKSFTGGTSNASCFKCHQVVHGVEFGDSTSQNFHAKYLQTNQYDVASCQTCHGVDFDGKGTVSKSCYKCHTVVHDKSFGLESSPNYHAKFIKNNNYNLAACQSCHGIKYDGRGVTVKNCLTCHSKPNGPENCTTCHGSVNAAPPSDLLGNSSTTVRGVGVHQQHLLGGLLGAAVACSECHVVPSTLLSAGHIDNSTHAEVIFDSTSSLFRSNAAYNVTDVSCANTYCHGNFIGGNQNRTMAWTDTSAAATECGTCHGDVTKTEPDEKAFPKSGHIPIGDNACVPCHASVINANMEIINPSKHINGKVDF